METPGQYNITGYQDFGTTLREQKRAALLNCVPFSTRCQLIAIASDIVNPSLNLWKI
jgi:hypothetical protein